MGTIWICIIFTQQKKLELIRYSVTASTVRFHRADPGSTPGIGMFFFVFLDSLLTVGAWIIQL
ncbi:uncharacterized protein PRCAT00002006001 [Priceomyces carsonii]|uniref:uncharacterized protein n=1 Tax=Priceomyces carsonii TaxID=28549 RepID=UPI002ED82987|nr:unnamed protein product [Priceomyces carsonii]